MEPRTKIRPVFCPRCRRRREACTLTELWINHAATFDYYSGGYRSAIGELTPGRPYCVEATCDCGYKWRLRGVQQITDLDEDTDNAE